MVPLLTLVWSAGAIPKRRRLVLAVRNDAMLPGPAVNWTSDWASMPRVVIAADDVCAWPCSVGILFKCVAFLSTLHWLASGADLGLVVLLCELWAGERLVLEKALPRYRRPGRPISVSAVPFGPGIDIWRSCRFIGALMRSLCALLGGIGRFVPCMIGANQCRLRQVGWENCGTRLTSWPERLLAWPFFVSSWSSSDALLLCHCGVVLLGLQVRSLHGGCHPVVGLLDLAFTDCSEG